ncbi:MAG: hypothetical protein COA41_19870 [Sphingopyxis sp.]|nr:MAG: hypothetical protein COA41_19870 [Sphingopyxis sp.]
MAMIRGTSMQDLNNIITELADRQSITDLLLAYCAACDRIDEAALRTCFHPDATHDHGGYVGPSSEWIAPALAWLKGRVGITHMISTPRIVIKGDRAASDCHFVAYNRTDKQEGMLEEVLVKGRYVDRLIRTEQGWQILHRTGIHDLELIREVPAETRPMAAGPSSGGPADDPFARELAALMGG